MMKATVRCSAARWCSAYVTGRNIVVVLAYWSLVVSFCIFSSGCSTEKPTDEKGTKVLMIGNSFSISLLNHLPQVAADRGVELDLASLCIGGCPLQKHWENAEKDWGGEFRPYRFDRNRFGEVTRSEMNICDALRLAKWDVVTIQQASHESWRPESYHPYGDKLVAKIRELAPQARIVVQETWSYTPWAANLKKWGFGRDEIYEKLHAAYGAFANEKGLFVIPFGTAVQDWRKRLPVRYTENSFGGDVVGGRKCAKEDWFKQSADCKWVPNCDLCHLNERGEYFQALVWLATLFDVDPKDVGYKPSFVTDDEARLMKEIAAELKDSTDGGPDDAFHRLAH